VIGGGDDRRLTIWDPPADDASEELPTPRAIRLDAAVGAIARQPGQPLVAVGRSDNLVQLWDPADGQERITLSGHASRVLALVWAPDGSWLASAGFDGVIKIWRTRS
jgi:WD40 repeat protein